MPTQYYQEIRNRLFGRLHKASGKKVAYNHKVSTHIGNQAAALPAFLSVLNKLDGFRQEGLFLTPGKVDPKPSIEELLSAILDDYQERGWTIEYKKEEKQ